MLPAFSGLLLAGVTAFSVLGALGLLLALLLLLVRDPKRGAMEEGPATAEGDQADDLVSGNWRHIIIDVYLVVKSTPALLWTMIGAVFLHIPMGAGQFRYRLARARERLWSR